MKNNFNQRFTYSNGTLKNKLGIKDAQQLSTIEYRISGQVVLQILKHPIKIQSLKQLWLIHKYMFKALYSWAGKTRYYQLQKNSSKGSNRTGSWFLRSNSFSNAIHYINQLIAKIQRKSKPVAIDYARLLDCINYLHPFREGNGRATKTFIELIAINHNQFIKYSRDSNDMINALKASDLKHIANLIKISKNL